MKKYFLLLMLVMAMRSFAQSGNAYLDSLRNYRDNYISHHEVVLGNDRKYLQFFPLDTAYRINCRFEKATDTKWFTMNTSGRIKKMYRRYGQLTFSIHDTTVHLYLYQSQSLMAQKEYRDYLFIPFTDRTSGEETYGAGRYLECVMGDIHNNILQLDFNKAYNPYCAYTSGYDCPVPPKENDLPVAIRAGEKNYGKPVH